MAFAQSIQVKRMIEGIAHDPPQTFWIMTINILADTSAVEWCKVFGSFGQKTHWTRVIPTEHHEDIQAKLLQAIDLTQAEWSEYQQSIVTYRDKMVSHHDLNAAISHFPHYDVAILAANFMFDQLREIADQDILGGIPCSLDRWSHSVAKNMSVIVNKAFKASAELGSNVPTSNIAVIGR